MISIDMFCCENKDFWKDIHFLWQRHAYRQNGGYRMIKDGCNTMVHEEFLPFSFSAWHQQPFQQIRL